MVDVRISASDPSYQTGDLSVFPSAIDDEYLLYTATNNAKVALKHTLTYNGKLIVVDPDTSDFPDSGVVRIGGDPANVGRYELIAYDSKTNNSFQGLHRAFAGSSQNTWSPGPNVYVTNSVVADQHNAVKDAIVNIEADMGTIVAPTANSLNGILKSQEVRFLSPKPLFRAFPKIGTPPLSVRFQNFTTGYVIRWFWDFGDGSTSLEKSPIHTYVSEGIYTVKLNVITSTGGSGVATKTNYITVSKDASPPFFYVESINNPYSLTTASAMTQRGNPTQPKNFLFIDQTDGDIVQRNWVFGDNTQITQEDPDIHTISHAFAEPGSYVVTLLIIFSDGSLKKVELPDSIVVI